LSRPCVFPEEATKCLTDVLWVRALQELRPYRTRRLQPDIDEKPRPPQSLTAVSTITLSNSYSATDGACSKTCGTPSATASIHDAPNNLSGASIPYFERRMSGGRCAHIIATKRQANDRLPIQIVERRRPRLTLRCSTGPSSPVRGRLIYAKTVGFDRFLHVLHLHLCETREAPLREDGHCLSL
jgi:hypothetical protein